MMLVILIKGKMLGTTGKKQAGKTYARDDGTHCDSLVVVNWGNSVVGYSGVDW